MMSEKQKMLALNRLFIFVFILLSCENNANQKKVKTQYDVSWQIGKDSFYNNCSQCHLPRIKDSLFMNYIDETINLDSEEKILKLSMVLTDSNHAGKNIRINPIDKVEIEKYILFIETPQRKVTKLQ
jgi:hypothetical protein